MSNENWYENGSWYEPLQREPEPAPSRKEAAPEPKKKKIWPRVLGGALLLLVIVIGLSLALRDPSGSSGEFKLPLPHTAGDSDTKTEAPSGKTPGSDAQPTEKPGRELPGGKDKTPSYREYFDELYPREEAQSSSIGIQRGKADTAFRLELLPTEGREQSLQQLYERCSPSVVGISAYAEGAVGYSWGSGVILSADGLILTNTHVVDGSDRATVTLYDDSEYEAVLIGYDTISDLAVLKIEAEGLPAAEFGDSGAIYVGQKVAAIGNPLGEQFRMTMTDGIISAISRDINYNGRTMTLMQTNAALNEGNSGGPLFNMYGQVIGITNMKMMSSVSSIEGIGFAIPTSTVLTVVNGILESGKVVGRVSIGITIGPIPDEAALTYGLPEGLYIADVVPGSDAAKKGVQIGDILMEVNGQPVTATKEVAEIKDQFGVGDELLFKLWRDGEIFELSVALVDTNDVYG